MKPRPFKRGSPFSASHMNQIISEAMRSRSDRATGPGIVNDNLGNQVFNEDWSRIRLCVAIEDFDVPAYPTDIFDQIDKAPSAKCLTLRLNSSADYVEEGRSVPFRVYDPIAYKNDSSLLKTGDAFWSVFNTDTKRWEVFSATSTSPEISAGVVRSRVGVSFYRIELGTFPNQAFFDSGECLDCDPCDNTYGIGTDGCGLSISDPPSILEPNGKIIVAYDTFSDKIHLVDNTDCVVAKLSGNDSSVYGYASYSQYGSDEVWVVLNGYHKHAVAYEEKWDCCIDTNGPPTLIERTPWIIMAVACDPIQCDECPPVSGS